ncbi:MAG: type IV pilus modification protein PilV [Gammaproteobacteria bacterium]|nr:type IV pilus modification protein PilV [Gammaproteobacteria bacterium]
MRQQNKGITLIEVLIAVVIISVGLLGMAGIQIQGLRGTQSSNVKGQATIVINDIAERIHANLGGVPDGLANLNARYSNVDTDALNCNTPITYCSNNASGQNVAICTTTEMAAFDIFIWACGDTDNDGLINVLPGGSATINCVDISPADAIDCNPGSSLNINIAWDEVSPDGNTLRRNLAMVVVP